MLEQHLRLLLDGWQQRRGQTARDIPPRVYYSYNAKKATCEDMWSMRKKVCLVHESLALEIQF